MVGLKDQYINSDSGWRLRLGQKQVDSEAVKVQKQEDCTFTMQGVWQATKLFNLDALTAGAYVYADKDVPTYWVLEDVRGSSIGENAVSPIQVYPTLSQGIVTVKSEEGADIKVLNITGEVLATYQSTGEISIELNYPNGVYFVVLDNGGKKQTYKIILQNNNNQ